MREDTMLSSTPAASEMQDILNKISEVRPPLRLCLIQKSDNAACGFHLSRTQWDPYPWISNVEDDSPASSAGLTIGDFVIEVNGEDILGLRIDEVAQKVRNNNDVVNLLVWKSTVTAETENKLPAAFNLQKFPGFLQSTMQLIECPVCLDIASGPTYQCVNGHILCCHCREKTMKCPMCRVSFSANGRCLVAEKLHALIRQTLLVKTETKPEEKPVVYSKRKSVRCEAMCYRCPFSQICTEKLLGDKAVFSHLSKCHSGPIIQYSIQGDAVTIRETTEEAVICIVNAQEYVFFLEKLSTGEHWLSILGDDNKASQFVFNVQNLDSIDSCTNQCSVNALTESIESILKKKTFFKLPLTSLGIKVTVQSKLKAVKS